MLQPEGEEAAREESGMDQHRERTCLEDAHLRAALQQARATVLELEQAQASSAAAAWHGNCATLERFLRLPSCTDEG